MTPRKPPTTKPAKAKKPREAGSASLATNAKGKPVPDWAMAAYTAWIGRSESITSIARGLGVDWQTVKRNIDKIHELICAVEDSDCISFRARHEARLTEVLKCLWRDYSKATSEAVRAQVLKTIADVSGQLAQVQGVTTQRHAHEVSGPEGGPVQIVIAPYEDENGGGSETDSNPS
jgi:hypothetical protein